MSFLLSTCIIGPLLLLNIKKRYYEKDQLAPWGPTPNYYWKDNRRKTLILSDSHYFKKRHSIDFNGLIHMPAL